MSVRRVGGCRGVCRWACGVAVVGGRQLNSWGRVTARRLTFSPLQHLPHTSPTLPQDSALLSSPPRRIPTLKEHLPLTPSASFPPTTAPPQNNQLPSSRLACTGPTHVYQPLAWTICFRTPANKTEKSDTKRERRSRRSHHYQRIAPNGRVKPLHKVI